MATYRSRSRSYSPCRRSRSPPRGRKRYNDEPRDRYRESRSYKERRSPAPSGLLVRNLPLDARPEDLRIPFERFGPVKDVYLPKNYYTGEFQAEITVIARTHHRNLVRLLGFCIEGSKKLLVYEYMSNGSLAHLLFKAEMRPNWTERVKIAKDVARGILYLHEDCEIHIIHCNIKPQNILMDDTWTAKISDFGLAKLLLPNHRSRPTTAAEATTGYSHLAPEWQKNALILVKTDTYSFGIMLLEIVCCRSSIEVNVQIPDEIILSNWVYNCFIGGELEKLVEDENVDFVNLERMVKVGLWCIQEDPAMRPLMRNVILMLEGTMDIPVPPSPVV